MDEQTMRAKAKAKLQQLVDSCDTLDPRELSGIVAVVIGIQTLNKVDPTVLTKLVLFIALAKSNYESSTKDDDDENPHSRN